MDEQAASRILENSFKLWFEPEVKRRLADGRLKKGASVWAVQVVLTLETNPEVRLRSHTQLVAADQFIAAAAGAIERGHDIAAIDNLYDAVQMMAKSYLLTTGDQRVLKAKTHGFIETGFNRQAKIGNVDAGSAQLLNRLARLRPRTRYALEPEGVTASELEAMLAQAKAMRESVERHRPKRARS